MAPSTRSIKAGPTSTGKPVRSSPRARQPSRRSAPGGSRRGAELPLALWPCAQTTSQWQRHGRYTPESNRHPAKMLPEIARRAIDFYSKPGDLILDPLCGIATSLVEAIHLERRAIGVELEPRWAALAARNVAHARSQGARGQALVLQDDARSLGCGVLDELAGQVSLILTSPPYANATLGDPRGGEGIARARACEERRVTRADRAHAASAARSCRYGEHPASLARMTYGSLDQTLAHPTATPCRESYLSAMAAVYTACARMLAPGGFLVLVLRDMRVAGALRNLTGDSVRLCQQAGLAYHQHVIALLASIDKGELRPRSSYWQRLHVQQAIDRGEPSQLPCFEDVLVLKRSNKR
jgi:modification methylase